MVVLLYFVTGGILGEKCLRYLFEVAEGAWSKRVEPVRGYTLQTGLEDPAHETIVGGVDRHHLLIVSEMLHRIAHSGVGIDSRIYKFLGKFASLNVF